MRHMQQVGGLLLEAIEAKGGRGAGAKQKGRRPEGEVACRRAHSVGAAAQKCRGPKSRAWHQAPGGQQARPRENKG